MPHSTRYAVVLVVVVSGLSRTVITQSPRTTQGPAVDGSPEWFLQGSFPDPAGRTIVDANGLVTVPARGDGPGQAATAAPAGAIVDTLRCRRSPLCGKRAGISRQSLQRVQWKQTSGYTFTYPSTHCLPASAAFPPSRSTRRTTSGSFNGPIQANRSCSSSTPDRH